MSRLKRATLSSFAVGVAITLASGSATWAYYAGYLNPAENGTATYTAVACEYATEYKAFSSEPTTATDYAYTKDLGTYCNSMRVRIYYVASTGSWAGWSNILTTAGGTAYLTTSGNMNQSWHAGS